MEEECALVRAGISYGAPIDRTRADVRSALAEAPRWRLLLQLDTDEILGTEWGDGGRLYFWMHDDDLRERRFDRVWCILQCH